MGDDEQGLRDLFAMAALQGLLAFAEHDWSDADAIAKGSYSFADAMLRERAVNRGPKPKEE